MYAGMTRATRSPMTSQNSNASASVANATSNRERSVSSSALPTRLPSKPAPYDKLMFGFYLIVAEISSAYQPGPVAQTVVVPPARLDAQRPMTRVSTQPNTLLFAGLVADGRIELTYPIASADTSRH